MIKITNGTDVLQVSSGAFKTQYKPFGWEIVKEELKVKPTFVAGDDKDEAALVIEKPLSEMTSKELKAKAKELGVDISSATNKSEARKMLADVIK